MTNKENLLRELKENPFSAPLMLSALEDYCGTEKLLEILLENLSEEDLAQTAEEFFFEEPQEPEDEEGFEDAD